MVERTRSRICQAILPVILCLVCTSAAAQQKITVSGTIRDKASGETIAGGVLTVAEDQTIGVKANEYGFYSLSLPQGKYTVTVHFVGYQEEKKTIFLEADQVVNWTLESKHQLQEIRTSARKKSDNTTKAQMGTEVLNMREIAKLPVIFGERDVIKTLQLLPGVKSTGEGSSGFSVRGGSTDQNLIILDEAPVYNASHLLGFFSTFNSDAIKDATIIKGNSPAQYGGRLSSVLDVKMKEGNNKIYSFSGGIGLISSRLTVEGPIQKEKSSFIVSARRTYADLFLKATKDFRDTKLYFYDLNAKANYKFNDRNRIYVSGYFGSDQLGLGSNLHINWGNTTGTLRWNHIVNAKLFSNTSFIYSNYDFSIGIKAGAADVTIKSRIRDWNLKQDFTYFANLKNSMRFGFNSILHTISPNTPSGSVSSSASKTDRQGMENAVYFTNEYKPTTRLNIEYGVRVSAYSIVGKGLYNIYDGNVRTDSVTLSAAELGKTYLNLEPRVTANYRIGDFSSVKLGYARNTQNLHLLSNSTGGSPSDQWIGNSYNIKPEIADLVSMGHARKLNNDNYELGIEAYFKSMQNQVDYRNGADIQRTADVESELLYGIGRAYGIELLLKKKTGKLTGWVGYTLSRTQRKIKGINNDTWYNARQDKTHDISLVGLYQVNTRWSVSGLFVYSTGNAVTFPTGKYILNNSTVFQYSDRNGNRMPANHRLDLSATYDGKLRGKFQGSWNFGLYNAYGRQNAYSISFTDSVNDPTKTEAVQTSLFRWVPSVTYNFKF
jgi:hypothetical protein